MYSLSVFYSGGRVVHSYGRLIPHELPITDLQQISGPDEIGRINCTVSSGTAMFNRLIGALETDDVTITSNGTTATLVVNPTNVTSFRNSDGNCIDDKHYLYLFLSDDSKCPTMQTLQLGKGYDTLHQ